MKIETIEEKIKARADEIVQGRIKAFQDAFKANLDALFAGETSGYGCDQFGGYDYPTDKHKENRDYDIVRDKASVIRLALCDKTTEGGAGRVEKKLPWPARLWRDEEQRVRNTLMSKMDELQRLMLTNRPPSPDDAVAGD